MLGNQGNYRSHSLLISNLNWENKGRNLNIRSCILWDNNMAEEIKNNQTLFVLIKIIRQITAGGNCNSV